MTMLPENPDGIGLREEFEGVRLSWPLPSMGPARYIFAVFFALGIGVWGVGIVAAVMRFITSPSIDMAIWIAGWIICGAWLPLVLWCLLRRRPESVLLAHDHIIYDPGWDMTSPVYLAALLSGNSPELKGRPITVAKSDFALNHADGRGIFEVAGKPIVIGAVLDEAQREWLYGVLESWRTGDPAWRPAGLS
jgi:hypothetical protein